MYRNAKDTIVNRDTIFTYRLKVIKEIPQHDLAIFRVLNTPPENINVERMCVKFDIATDLRMPILGEPIIYCGFPLLLGRDTRLTHNNPAVINGYISQVIADRPDYLIQAPIFSGASGSPIFSQSGGKFLGIVYGKIGGGQESLLYAIKSTIVTHWIKKNLREELISGN